MRRSTSSSDAPGGAFLELLACVGVEGLLQKREKKTAQPSTEGTVVVSPPCRHRGGDNNARASPIEGRAGI